MALPPAVVIHGLPHARLALSVGRPVTLLSAPGAPSFAGCSWWAALIALARAEYPGQDTPNVLDCGDAPGRVLEGLSVGCRIIVLRPCPAFDGLRLRLSTEGAVLLPAPPISLDLAQRGAARHLTVWLTPVA